MVSCEALWNAEPQPPTGASALEKREERTRSHDADAFVALEGKQVRVPGDNELGGPSRAALGGP